MPEFLEVIENIRAEEASVQRLFRGEGVRVRSRGTDPEYMSRLVEAAGFISDVLQGRRPSRQLREALGTSDFPLLFGDVLDRQLLANYRAAPVTFPAYIRVRSVPDFRSVSRFSVDGSEAVLPAVNEQEEYPASSLTEGRDQYSVAKYGRRIPFSWESMINDDLDALKDVPARFGKAASRSEEKFATQLFCDASGPHATLYSSGNGNIITSNPVLSTANLQAALTQQAARKDTDGEPIVSDQMHLVVGPALEITARNILDTAEFRVTDGSGNVIQVVRGNGLGLGLTLHVNRYIPIVASSANGTTSWWLFGDPGGTRPAAEFGRLRGHEEPEIFIKTPNMQRVGGGAAAPLDGDFSSDSIEYKVRHIFGGARLTATGGFRSTLASNGSGS